VYDSRPILFKKYLPSMGGQTIYVGRVGRIPTSSQSEATISTCGRECSPSSQPIVRCVCSRSARRDSDMQDAWPRVLESAFPRPLREPQTIAWVSKATDVLASTWAMGWVQRPLNSCVLEGFNLHAGLQEVFPAGFDSQRSRTRSERSRKCSSRWLSHTSKFWAFYDLKRSGCRGLTAIRH